MLLDAAVLICKLEDNRLYAPWEVVASGYDRKTQRKEYDRLRLNLGEWTRYHNIRETFENKDASGKRRGRFPAWYGRTWKEHLGYRDLMAATTWIQENEVVLKPESPTAPHQEVFPTIELTIARTDTPPAKGPRITLRWVAVAAVFLISLLIIHKVSAIPLVDPLSDTTATESPLPTETLSEIQEFTSQRRAARASSTAVRRSPMVHPPIDTLVWEMEIVDDLRFQAAYSPNCVFLISRTHQGMMPIPD